MQSPVPSLGGIQSPRECFEDAVAVPESKEKMDNMVDNILSAMFPKASLDDERTEDPMQSDVQAIGLGGGKDIVTPQ